MLKHLTAVGALCACHGSSSSAGGWIGATISLSVGKSGSDILASYAARWSVSWRNTSAAVFGVLRIHMAFNTWHDLPNTGKTLSTSARRPAAVLSGETSTAIRM